MRHRTQRHALVCCLLLPGCFVQSRDPGTSGDDGNGSDEGTSGPESSEGGATGLEGPESSTDSGADAETGGASGTSSSGSSGSSGGSDESDGSSGTDGLDTDAESSSDEDTGGDTGEPPVDDVPSLLVADYIPGTGVYEFGAAAIPIVGAPRDVDWSRAAMLHDGARHRLYFMPEGRADAVHQFGFDPDEVEFEYGFDSIPTIPIQGTPEQADTSSFAMLHDGSAYRLYFTSSDDPLRIYQHGFDPATGAYVFGHDSIPEIAITDTPAGADWTGWDMLHDGEHYRLYAYESSERDSLVQHAFDGSSYRWGHESIPVLELSMIPANADRSDFMMLHDGNGYRLYMLTLP